MMSGTSASNAPTLSSDAPSSVQCPTTTEKQSASESPSSTPHSLRIGQVVRKACSLENPFYAVSYASFTSFHADDPSRKHPNDLLKETGKYLRNWHSWTSSSKEEAKEETKFRPVIRAPVPTWAEGDERNLSWVFLMGTIGGHTQETLPQSLKRFAIPVQSSSTVVESESGASSSVSIRTTPMWKLKKGKEQCWIIGIPVGIPAAEAPTESWCDHTNYWLDPEEMEKLMSTSDKMLAEFSVMSQDIHLFDEFVWDLRTSRKDKTKQAASPNKNATNKVSVGPPTPSKPSRVHSTPASPTPTKAKASPKKTESTSPATPCNLAKRRRQSDGDDELEPSTAGDKSRKQRQASSSSSLPLRSSKRLCTANGKKSQSQETSVKSQK